MANLVIEIGNTALKAAWAEGKTLGKTFRYQGEKFMEYILSLDLSPDSIWFAKSGMFTLLSELVFRILKHKKELPDREILKTELVKLNESVKNNGGQSPYSEFYYYMYQGTGSKIGRDSRGKVLRAVLERL